MIVSKLVESENGFQKSSIIEKLAKFCFDVKIWVNFLLTNLGHMSSNFLSTTDVKPRAARFCQESQKV